MFRRKEEDGTDSPEQYEADAVGTTANLLDKKPEQAATASAPVSAPAAASAAAPRPAQPAQASPQAAAPATPAFRPAPPQAALAAARPAAPAAAPAAASPNIDRSTPKAAAKRVLTVGPDIQMKGEITTCDRVVIEGAVDATLREVHTVELAESGSLKGTAEVQDAEISGSFEGDLIVRGRLIIYSAGRVRGNVTYGEIEIERGGQISGNIRNVADADNKQNNGSQRKVA